MARIGVQVWVEFAFDPALVLEVGELWHGDFTIEFASGAAVGEVLPEKCLLGKNRWLARVGCEW